VLHKSVRIQWQCVPEKYICIHTAQILVFTVPNFEVIFGIVWVYTQFLSLNLQIV
jgi:hypothetical protein